MAFEGDRVTLDNGRFESVRFTDVRRIGEGGKEIDPFPDYPKSDRYSVQSQTIEFALMAATVSTVIISCNTTARCTC